MEHRSRIGLLLALLMLGMSGAAAEATTGVPGTLQITFGSTPHWTTVPGTSVRSIGPNEGPGYDMFRYGNYYYAYNNASHRWYRSSQSHGRYSLIDDHSVPTQFKKIPPGHWRNYPPGWRDGGTPGSSGHAEHHEGEQHGNGNGNGNGNGKSNGH